jgi:hypothetical protein
MIDSWRTNDRSFSTDVLAAIQQLFHPASRFNNVKRQLKMNFSFVYTKLQESKLPLTIGRDGQNFYLQCRKLTFQAPSIWSIWKALLLHNMRLASKLCFVLNPAPSADPEDPLNWTRRRKLLSIFCSMLYTWWVAAGVGATPTIMTQITEATGLATSQLTVGVGKNPSKPCLFL